VTVERAGRRRILTLIAAVALVATAVIGVVRAHVDTGMDSFIPAADPAVAQLEQKARAFGGDPVIVLLESGEPGQFFDVSQELPKLVGLEGDLARLPDVAAVYGPATALNQTAGAAQNMLAQISGRRDALRIAAEYAARHRGVSGAEVAAAGRRAVAAFDRRYGSLLVSGLPAGLPTLRNQQFVQTVLFGQDGTARPQWRIVVPSPTSVAILVRPRDDLHQDGTARLVAAVRAAVGDSALPVARATVSGAPVITSALADRARSEFTVLGGASVLAVSLVFLLMPWSRRRRSRLRPTLAALAGTSLTLAIFTLAGRDLSLGVVAFLPILLGIGSDFPLYLSQGGRDRQALTAATAGACAFAGLALSPLPFVRELGLALAVGIACTAVVALFMRWLWGPVPGPAPRTRTSGVGSRLPRVSTVQRVVLAGAALALAAVGWTALPQLAVQADPERLAQGLPELADADYVEQAIGSSGEVSVLLTGPDATSPAALAYGAAVESRIVRAYGDRVHPVLSLSDLLRFLGDHPTAQQVDAALQLLPPYLSSAVVTSDRSVGQIVLGVEFDDLAQFQELLHGLRSTLGTPPAGVQVQVVGLPVAAARGLQLVSDGRLLLNLAGIGIAALVLLVGLRSWRLALLGLSTTLVSTGWIVLVAWGTTGTLNPLTVAVGSLTTATGCEFAVMLAGGGVPGLRLRSVATAALAGCVGYLSLGLSHLAVLRDFGLLLPGSVACSFVAALLVTWLAGAVGRRGPVEVAASTLPIKKEVLV